MSQLLRQAFSDAAISTVSPSRIVVMCFERIDRDLAGCIEALGRADIAAANELSCHAQDIVTELLGALDQDAWEHAGTLAGLYTWALTTLVSANVKLDAAAVAEVRGVLAEIATGFSEASLTAAPADGPLSTQA
jgi:flagellar biosynthetic protein FliS